MRTSINGRFPFFKNKEQLTRCPGPCFEENDTVHNTGQEHSSASVWEESVIGTKDEEKVGKRCVFNKGHGNSSNDHHQDQVMVISVFFRDTSTNDENDVERAMRTLNNNALMHAFSFVPSTG